MEKQNRVSIWVGKTQSKAELEELMREIYDDEGDSSSKFMESFKIEFIDTQFQEVFYFEDINEKGVVFDGFSYIESFIDNIPDLNWIEKNSIVLLYNFQYEGNVESALGLDYLGSFDYSDL